MAALFGQLEVEDSTNLLNSTALAGDYDADGDVDDADFAGWKNSFGSVTKLYGRGADGDFDSVVDAADYKAWRNGFGANGAGDNSFVNYVPEPLSMLSILAAVASCSRLKKMRTRDKLDSPINGK